MIPLYLTCIKIPESGKISWRIKVSSGKRRVCPKTPHHYDSIELSPVQSSPDPIRCPMAPGTHVKMKPVIFPGGIFGYLGIFQSCFFTVPLLSQSCRGAPAKLSSSCSVPVPTGFGVVLSGAG